MKHAVGCWKKNSKELAMPLIEKNSPSMPAWCELEHYEIVALAPGAGRRFATTGRKQKLIVGQGRCRIAFGGQTLLAGEGANLDLPADDGSFEVIETLDDAVLVYLAGRWGDEVGGSGLFSVRTSDAPQDGALRPLRDHGDPVTYPKETNFDRHYHDMDEYWIVFQGRGVAVSEGKHYEVGAGDCIATGMGHHHDFPLVIQPVKAVFFETTMAGQKRRGHLWEHTHGKAQPKLDRV
jgi:mannose-6-phosphate isomerase-like protein (cupin superfamily)